MWISHVSESAHQVAHTTHIDAVFPILLSIWEFDFLKINDNHFAITGKQEIAKVQVTMLSSVVVELLESFLQLALQSFLFDNHFGHLLGEIAQRNTFNVRKDQGRTPIEKALAV